MSDNVSEELQEVKSNDLNDFDSDSERRERRRQRKAKKEQQKLRKRLEQAAASQDEDTPPSDVCIDMNPTETRHFDASTAQIDAEDEKIQKRRKKRKDERSERREPSGASQDTHSDGLSEDTPKSSSAKSEEPNDQILPIRDDCGNLWIPVRAGQNFSDLHGYQFIAAGWDPQKHPVVISRFKCNNMWFYGPSNASKCWGLSNNGDTIISDTEWEVLVRPNRLGEDVELVWVSAGAAPAKELLADAVQFERYEGEKLIVAGRRIYSGVPAFGTLTSTNGVLSYVKPQDPPKLITVRSAYEVLLVTAIGSKFSTKAAKINSKMAASRKVLLIKPDQMKSSIDDLYPKESKVDKKGPAVYHRPAMAGSTPSTNDPSASSSVPPNGPIVWHTPGAADEPEWKKPRTLAQDISSSENSIIISVLVMLCCGVFCGIGALIASCAAKTAFKRGLSVQGYAALKAAFRWNAAGVTFGIAVTIGALIRIFAIR